MSVMLRPLAKTLASSVKPPEVTTKQPAATLGYVSPMTFEQRGKRPSSKTGSPHNGRLKESGKQGQD